MQNKTNKLLLLLLGEEESVGPISAVHSHGYYAKKIAFFERAHNSIVSLCGMRCMLFGHRIDGRQLVLVGGRRKSEDIRSIVEILMDSIQMDFHHPSHRK